MNEGSDASKAVQAKGILLQVKCFRFLLCLIIFDRLLTCSKGLSDVLQSKQLNLAKAAELVVGTIEIFHSDQQWERLLSYAKSVAEVHDISIDLEVPAAHSRQ